MKIKSTIIAVFVLTLLSGCASYKKVSDQFYAANINKIEIVSSARHSIRSEKKFVEAVIRGLASKGYQANVGPQIDGTYFLAKGWIKEIKPKLKIGTTGLIDLHSFKINRNDAGEIYNTKIMMALYDVDGNVLLVDYTPTIKRKGKRTYSHGDGRGSVYNVVYNETEGEFFNRVVNNLLKKLPDFAKGQLNNEKI